MARGQISKYEKAEKPKTVTCGTCCHFHRDTSGPSRNIYTGIYFMGESDIGCDPDRTYIASTGVAKIFANKPRICNLYKQAQ